MYVYIESEKGLWTAGFYDPEDNWVPDSDHFIKEEAAKRVAWLNGNKTSSVGRQKYKYLRKYLEPNQVIAQGIVSELAEEGWEMVCGTGDVFWFKKEIQ